MKPAPLPTFKLYGKVYTPADLPRDVERWTPLRKTEVLFAVRSGMLTLIQASERWSITVDEIESWWGLFQRHGDRGLRSTRLQACLAPSETPEELASQAFDFFAKATGVRRSDSTKKHFIRVVAKTIKRDRELQ